MPKISIDEIETTAKTALIKHGADDAIAKNFARAVVQAEGLGNRICGLDYLESYCVQLQSSRVRGDVSPMVSQPNPGVVHVDAKFGFAQPDFAAELLGDRACAYMYVFGLFYPANCRAWYNWSWGYKCLAHRSRPGGKARTLGTNLIAFSVPDGRGGVALQFDQ